MISYEDCVALSELTQEEIDAIAEHEHLPTIAALEEGDYLAHSGSGQRTVKRMIEEDIKAAIARGDHLESAKLKLALRHFVERHPAA